MLSPLLVALTVVNPLAKLFEADPGRKTRFHDLAGRVLPPESWGSLPLAVMDMTLRVAGRRRQQTWISRGLCPPSGCPIPLGESSSSAPACRPSGSPGAVNASSVSSPTLSGTGE